MSLNAVKEPGLSLPSAELNLPPHWTGIPAIPGARITWALNMQLLNASQYISLVTILVHRSEMPVLREIRLTLLLIFISKSRRRLGLVKLSLSSFFFFFNFPPFSLLPTLQLPSSHKCLDLVFSLAFSACCLSFVQALLLWIALSLFVVPRTVLLVPVILLPIPPT